MNAFCFVSDTNKIPAVLVALCSFNFFRTLKIPYSKVINAFGMATLGVFPVHVYSDTMRQWLRRDTLDNIGTYGFGKLLPVYALCGVLGVFLICACINMLRIRFIGKPLFAQYDRLKEKHRTK